MSGVLQGQCAPIVLAARRHPRKEKRLPEGTCPLRQPPVNGASATGLKSVTEVVHAPAG
jgi:hypothetical protein